MHKKGYIHRDIKPDNILTKKGDDYDLLYLVDFGVSKKIYKKDGNLIKARS